MNKIRKILVILLILIMWGGIKAENAVYAKASEAKEENFANIVLFAHFAGENSEQDKKYFEENRNEIIKLYDGTHGRSATNYLNTISYGKFHLKNIFPQDDGTKITSYELKTDKSSAYQRNVDSLIIDELIKNIPGIKDKIVDYNGDGYMDNLTVVLKGGNEQQVIDHSTFVLHKSDYDAEAYWSGKKIGAYNILNTYALIDSIVSSQSGVIAHEFLHTLGYPDLYRSSGNDKPVYSWDIMGAASRYMPYPLAYLRMYFTNWLDIDTITKSQTVTLDRQDNKDGNQAYIIKSPLNDDEVFVIEFRKKAPISYTDENSLDRGIGGSGIIVYRINTTVEGLSNNFNQTGVYIFRPNEPGKEFSENTEEARILSAYLSQESGRTSIGTTDLSKKIEDGALTFSDGTNSGITISNISSSAGDSMTCTVTIPEISETNLWKNTNFKDLTEQDYNKNIGIANYKNTIYTVTYSNNKIYTQTYDGTNWKQEISTLNINETYPITQIDLITTQNKLYLCYSMYGTLQIKELNNTTKKWEDVTKINNIIGEFGITNHIDKLYITCVGENSETARLIEINNKTITELGTYFNGKYCGQANVVELNGNIYTSVRSTNGNKIKLYKYNNGKFTEIENTMSSGSYDIKSFNNKIYISLGKENTQKAMIYIYDGNTLKPINSNIELSFPKIVTAQNSIYILMNTSDYSGKAKLYKFDTLNNIFDEKSTIDIDTAISKAKAVTLDNYIYTIISKKSDEKIIVKKKQYKSEENPNKPNTDPLPEPEKELPFTDVKKSDWSYKAIKYMYNNKYISGTTSTTFSPKMKLTRGMLVTILHNMEGKPNVSGKSKFPDVQNTNEYYYSAVKWASKNNIVNGYNNGKFGPNDPITREQLAVMLNQYSIYKGTYKKTNADFTKFSDSNKISDFAKWGMNWAVGTGVITGTTEKTLIPQGTASREEAAAMIYKYFLSLKNS